MSRTSRTTPSLQVLDAGPLTTVQDAGRTGWAHLGVPRSGYLDAPAATLANRLVGNAEDSAVLETTLGGVTVRPTRSVRLSVTGAWADVRVDGRPERFAEAVSVPAGAVVTVGPARWGVRSYVAVDGGVVTPSVLGSRSGDTLAGLGTPALRDGDELPLGEPCAPSTAGGSSGPAVGSGRGRVLAGWVGQSVDAVRVLRVLAGPRADWLDAPTRLGAATFRVGDRSNRVGLRLEGAVLGRRAGELASEGIVLGAVQLPPSGEPIVFLNDHPTTGGYPVVAVVVGDDLPLCGQLRPGDQVRLEPVEALSPRPTD